MNLSAQQSNYARTKNLFLVLDFSNLWLAGTELAATANGFAAKKDFRWRLDVASLVDVMLEEYRDCILTDLYVVGSNEVQMQSVWRSLEDSCHSTRVHSHSRSSWNRREKMVDSSIMAYVGCLQQHIEKLKTMQQLELVGQHDAATESCRILGLPHGIPFMPIEDKIEIVICSGDIDYAPLWFDTDFLRFGHKDDVCKYRRLGYLRICGFSNALNTMWRSNPVLSEHVMLLDRHFDAIGHTQAILDMPLSEIPSHASFVVMGIATSLISSLADVSRPVRLVRIESRPNDIVVLANESELTADAVTDLMNEFSSVLPEDTRLVSFVVWKQNRERLEREEDERRAASSDSSSSSADMDAEWIIVNERKSKRKRASPPPSPIKRKVAYDRALPFVPHMRCNLRQYCPNGLKCTYGHTKSELDVFYRNHGAGLVCTKKTACERGQSCIYYYDPKRCRYAHGPNDFFCTICDKKGNHTNEECDNANQRWNPDTARVL